MFVLVILSPHSILGKAWGPMPEGCEGPQMCPWVQCGQVELRSGTPELCSVAGWAAQSSAGLQMSGRSQDSAT